MKMRMTFLVIFLLCQLVNMVSSVWMFVAILVNSPRAWALAVAYDQLANTTFGGNCNETISSRAWRARNEGKRWGCVLCKLLDRLDKDHCNKSANPLFTK